MTEHHVCSCYAFLHTLQKPEQTRNEKGERTMVFHGDFMVMMLLFKNKEKGRVVCGIQKWRMRRGCGH